MDSAGDLFIADADNNRVREVNLTTGVITTVAGNGIGGYSGDNGPATAAELATPGVAVDATGNLFITNSANNVVREVNLATGMISTVAGEGDLGLRAMAVRPPPPNCRAPQVLRWTPPETCSSPITAITASARSPAA